MAGNNQLQDSQGWNSQSSAICTLNCGPAMFVETFAINQFLRNHDDLTAFCVLTHNPRFRPWEAITPEEIAKLPEKEAQSLLTMNTLAHTGTAIAGNLAIVYLVSIMEAYVKDVAYELLNKKITEVTHKLIGDPVVTTEDEDIMRWVAIEDEEEDETKPFYFVSNLARQHAESLLRNDSVVRGIKFLEGYFGIRISDRDLHLRNWAEIKKIRNVIVHSKASSKQKSILDPATRNSAPEPIDPEQITRWLATVFAFARDIEFAIFTQKHGPRLAQEPSD